MQRRRSAPFFSCRALNSVRGRSSEHPPQVGMAALRLVLPAAPSWNACKCLHAGGKRSALISVLELTQQARAPRTRTWTHGEDTRGGVPAAGRHCHLPLQTSEVWGGSRRTLWRLRATRSASMAWALCGRAPAMGLRTSLLCASDGGASSSGSSGTAGGWRPSVEAGQRGGGGAWRRRRVGGREGSHGGRTRAQRPRHRRRVSRVTNEQVGRERAHVATLWTGLSKTSPAACCSRRSTK